jgi:hypothetical protein
LPLNERQKPAPGNIRSTGFKGINILLKEYKDNQTVVNHRSWFFCQQVSYHHTSHG